MPETQITPKKVVIVEDNIAMREIVVHKLTTNGFEVKEAGDGKEGVNLILSEKPDIVLLDLMLPEVDGFQVLETIRKNADQKVANTPIIVLSNLWSNKDILKTKALKVQAYLVKAYFTTEEILKKVNDVLANPSSISDDSGQPGSASGSAPESSAPTVPTASTTPTPPAL